MCDCMLERVYHVIVSCQNIYHCRVRVNINTAQKMKLSIKDLLTFTEEIFNGKLHFLCSVNVHSHMIMIYILT